MYQLSSEEISGWTQAYLSVIASQSYLQYCSDGCWALKIMLPQASKGSSCRLLSVKRLRALPIDWLKAHAALD